MTTSAPLHERHERHAGRIDRPDAQPCADALELLAQGHERARALADECRRSARCLSADQDVRALAQALCDAMHRLAALEEGVLYPAARAAMAAAEAAEVLQIAELEHATARQIIRGMQDCDPCCARYEALVLALADCVERHARHEQGALFPRVRASCLDLADLAERLGRRERELDLEPCREAVH